MTLIIAIVGAAILLWAAYVLGFNHGFRAGANQEADKAMQRHVRMKRFHNHIDE